MFKGVVKEGKNLESGMMRYGKHKKIVEEMYDRLSDGKTLSIPGDYPKRTIDALKRMGLALEIDRMEVQKRGEIVVTGYAISMKSDNKTDNKKS